MALHPQVISLLDKMSSANLKPAFTLTPVEARKQMDEMAAVRDSRKTLVGSVEEIDVPGPAGKIVIRIYRPSNQTDKNLPLFIYFHGGGHVIGSLDSHDEVARVLCSGANCLLASVDYRLAPEHKFPAAVDDAFSASLWLSENAHIIGADPNNIVIGGDSAGANLAIVVALMARDTKNMNLVAQYLIYPVVDYNFESVSYSTYAEGYGPLTKNGMMWFKDHYLSNEGDVDDWRASPIKASDLSGLPSTVLITAECDVLHDEGVRLAKALLAAGTSVKHVDYPGMVHGFFSFAPYLDDGKMAQKVVCQHLTEIFSKCET